MRGKTTPKTTELNQKIIELYKSGLSGEKIAKELQLGNSYVRKILRENGFKRNSVWKQKDADIVKYFLDSRDRQDTAKFFNIAPSTVTRILKRNNVPIKTHKHNFNENIFEVIDTEEKAYWLGFIYADGCVIKSDKEFKFEITLSTKDKMHLVKFNNFINGDSNIIKEQNKIYNNKVYSRVRWTVSNKKLCSDLIKNGVVPRKTYTLTFPSEEILPEKLVSHFIRGFFDGDGSISTKETSTSTLMVQLIGTKSMLKECLNRIKISTTLINNNSVTDPDLCHFQLKVAKSIKFLQYIYNNATIYLDRKYSLWQNYCRSNSKVLELLESKIGEGWEVNPEVIKILNYS